MKRIVLLGLIVFFYWVINQHSDDKSQTKQGFQSIKPPSYEQLLSYPLDCSKADQQLTELKLIQKVKNFDPDPDNLSDSDRAYNARLKSSIWWYAYRCKKS